MLLILLDRFLSIPFADPLSVLGGSLSGKRCDMSSLKSHRRSFEQHTKLLIFFERPINDMHILLKNAQINPQLPPCK